MVLDGVVVIGGRNQIGIAPISAAAIAYQNLVDRLFVEERAELAHHRSVGICGSVGHVGFLVWLAGASAADRAVSAAVKSGKGVPAALRSAEPRSK